MIEADLLEERRAATLCIAQDFVVKTIGTLVSAMYKNHNGDERMRHLRRLGWYAVVKT